MSGAFWRITVLAGAMSLSPITQAQQGPHPLSVDLAVTYTAERAKIATTGCGCFWLQGGSVNGAIRIFRGLSVATNLTGEHASAVGGGVDINKLAFMAGPRWTNHWLGDRHKTSVFGEALFGIAHGFDSIVRLFGNREQRQFVFLQVGGPEHRACQALRLARPGDWLCAHQPAEQRRQYSERLRLAAGVFYHLGK